MGTECSTGQAHKFNYHAYITSVADFEHSLEVPAQDPDDTRRVIIYIGKVGGGTVGKSYEGNWYVMLSVDGEPLYHGDRFVTRKAATHDQAARLFAGMLEIVCPSVAADNGTLWDRLDAFSENRPGVVTIAPGLTVRPEDEEIARRAYQAGQDDCRAGH